MNQRVLSSIMSGSRSSPRLQALLCRGLGDARGFLLVLWQPSLIPQQRCEAQSNLPQDYSPPLQCFWGSTEGALKFPTKFLQTSLGLSNIAAQTCTHAQACVNVCLLL